GVSWTVSETRVRASVESSGGFSIAFKGSQGLIVGGDYRKPTDSGATAAMTEDGGRTWVVLNNQLPFRSAVTWAGDRWVAVGTSGSHHSADGKAWQEVDRENYNAVSFAPSGEGWAVGPKGRIARFVR